MTRGVGITELLRETLPEWSVPIFEITALLGDEFLVGAVLLALACTDAYRSFRRGEDRLLTDRTAFVLAVVLGGLSFALALKAALGLPRPPESLRAIPKETPGFPSGHTMAATVLWTALALWATRSTRRRRVAVAAVPVVLVAVSRLALGVHFLVDVVASVGFGVGYLLLAAKITDRDPTKAFAVAAVLGTAALVITGGTTEGWLAFVGCLGGTVGWWVITRQSVRELWVAASS